MSTRATIAAIMTDGKIGEIYCHNDGDLSFVGRTLVNYYKTQAKTDQLLKLGDISKLGRNVEPSELVKRFGFDGAIDEEFLSLSSQDQLELLQDDSNHVKAYHRDRGETLTLNLFDNIPQYLDYMKDNSEEFNYFMGYNKQHKLQWYLLTDEGFLELLDDSRIEKDDLKSTQINIVDFDDDSFVKQLANQRKTLILQFLQILGDKYHLFPDSDCKPQYNSIKNEYFVAYQDPVSKDPFPLTITDNKIENCNFEHEILANIVNSIKAYLLDTLPLYNREDVVQLKQLEQLKTQISTFYRKKYDPDSVAFNYFVALCQDKHLTDLARKKKIELQSCELQADDLKEKVKPYVVKKVDKLFADFISNNVEGISITYSIVAALTEKGVRKPSGEILYMSKFDDYEQDLLTKRDPDSEERFADPLVNSQIYSIFNGLYQRVVAKDTAHKLDQVMVIQAK